MFRYFPKNYVWNLSVDLSIEMGARIGEIEEMCAPLLAASEHPDAEGTRAFRETRPAWPINYARWRAKMKREDGGCRRERSISGRPTIT